jgi:hypothetical protein
LDRERSLLIHISEKVETVLTYANILFEEDEDELIILLVSSLPNLQKLYMVLPETWEPEHNVLHRFLENTSKLAAFNVLQQLETLYICSALCKTFDKHSPVSNSQYNSPRR